MKQNFNKPTNDLSDIINLEIPEDLATLQLPDPSLLMYYKNLENRIIWIDKDIDGSLLNECKQIIRWNMEDKKNNISIEDRKKIIICIESYGGTLDSTFAMIDIMKMSQTPVVTVAFFAMSAACLIFINGKERYVLDKSVLLIHQGSGGSGGTYDQMESSQENYKKLIEMMKENIIKNTKIDSKTYNKYKLKDWYLYSDDAIKYGLADKIICDINDII